MMLKRFAPILAPACVVLAALCACRKGSDGFTVTVDVPEIGTQQMTVVYTTDNGNRNAMSMPSVNGAFEFKVSGASTSIVEIFTSTKQLYAALIAENGDHITLRSSEGRLQADGSEMSQQLLNYRPGDDVSALPEEVRNAVAIVYPRSERTDWPEFTAPELIIAKDSVMTPDKPLGVWFFTSSDNQRTSMLLDTIRAYAARKAPVYDVFIGVDTTMWRMAIRRDEPTWTQGLAPDAPLVLDGILTSTPLLVEVDSAGTVRRTQRLE